MEDKINALYELVTQIAGELKQTREELSNTRQELSGQITGVRDELQGQITGVRQELTGRFLTGKCNCSAQLAVSLTAIPEKLIR